jgi:hypothetical protein
MSSHTHIFLNRILAHRLDVGLRDIFVQHTLASLVFARFY